VVTLVIGVVHPAVEQLHADGHARLLRGAGDLFQAGVQFSRPCSSGSPARLPEKQITLGRPASAQALMRSIMEGRISVVFEAVETSAMVVVPLAIAQ